LSAGVNSNVTVNVIPPGTLYTGRLNQADLRFARAFGVGRSKWKGILDLYNVFNDNAILLWNSTYGTTGSSWIPQNIMPARLLKFEVQLNF
jgi:hypothetical protein